MARRITIPLVILEPIHLSSSSSSSSFSPSQTASMDTMFYKFYIQKAISFSLSLLPLSYTIPYACSPTPIPPSPISCPDSNIAPFQLILHNPSWDWCCFSLKKKKEKQKFNHVINYYSICNHPLAFTVTFKFLMVDAMSFRIWPLSTSSTSSSPIHLLCNLS